MGRRVDLSVGRWVGRSVRQTAGRPMDRSVGRWVGRWVGGSVRREKVR